MEWAIDFFMNKGLDRVFIHKLFYFLVSKGVTYNAKYAAMYMIMGENSERDVQHMESDVKESTEKLAEIIETYLCYDLKTTLLRISLEFPGNNGFEFEVTIIPSRDEGSLINFVTNTAIIEEETTFLSFVELCKETFIRFNFEYGAFRDEYNGTIPAITEKFIKTKPDIVNFYSRPITDAIGREKLLSAPAFKVEELENGGVMLIVCTEAVGCPEAMERVWHHLGYN